jgi:hypothetical protein
MNNTCNEVIMLPYTNEIIASPDGIDCRVLDGNSISFAGAVEGRKSTETLVRRAEGGEKIETRNADRKVESIYVAQPGDAIFINLHNPDDIYVPGNPDGSRWQFSDLTTKGYEISGDDHEHGGVRVKSAQVSRLLHEAVHEPTCIKDAWGAGQHQFLFKGATLKLNGNGAVTGIDKTAFDATWEISKDATLPTPQSLPELQQG